MEIINKICTKCKQSLPINIFPYSNRYKDKHNSWCKPCKREYQKAKRDVPIEVQIERKIKRLSTMRVNVLSIENAAYIAGLLDGEGCICLTKSHQYDGRTPSYSINIRISNNCIEVLNWLLIVIGYGSVYPKTNKKCGEWALRNSRTSDFLKQIYPYLKIKKLQAEVAIKYTETLMDLRHGCNRLTNETIVKREELRTNIIDLNSRFKTQKIVSKS